MCVLLFELRVANPTHVLEPGDEAVKFPQPRSQGFRKCRAGPEFLVILNGLEVLKLGFSNFCLIWKL